MTDTKVDALAEYVRYLRDCIQDGVIDPEPLEKWVSRIYGCAWAELGQP